MPDLGQGNAGTEFRLLCFTAETRSVPWKLFERSTDRVDGSERDESVAVQLCAFADAFYKYSNTFARMRRCTALRKQEGVEHKGFDALGNEGMKRGRGETD